MDEVLIVGNGISRLSYDSLIREWPGEVWGCNYAFQEFCGAFDRIAGHVEAMHAASEYRDQHQCRYQIWGGHLGAGGATEHVFTCPKRYQKDTGTTLVAQALFERRHVAAVGFDLGGPDAISPGIEHQDKTNWVKRWRAILGEYGYDRIRFIGYDHLPYIGSRRSPAEYMHRYKAGKPHLADEQYLKQWKQWSGKKYAVSPEVIMAKVIYPDGREVEMPDAIAIKMAEKGKVELVKAKPKAQTAPKKQEPKKEEAEL